MEFEAVLSDSIEHRTFRLRWKNTGFLLRPKGADSGGQVGGKAKSEHALRYSNRKSRLRWKNTSFHLRPKNTEGPSEEISRAFQIEIRHSKFEIDHGAVLPPRPLPKATRPLKLPFVLLRSEVRQR
jgi:hypothetical protein